MSEFVTINFQLSKYSNGTVISLTFSRQSTVQYFTRPQVNIRFFLTFQISVGTLHEHPISCT